MSAPKIAIVFLLLIVFKIKRPRKNEAVTYQKFNNRLFVLILQLLFGRALSRACLPAKAGYSLQFSFDAR
ncbi:MAG: hypothetical protein CMF36_10670 [Leeuwenhoekiella sp.]|nr:hypothetical protein [Leeuwenhoekiella sp.]MBA81585.1 hypothetical protein [Leeuwenhoekiella sp.]